MILRGVARVFVDVAPGEMTRDDDIVTTTVAAAIAANGGGGSCAC